MKFILLYSILISLQASAKNMSIATLDWPPYVESKLHSGLALDIVKAVYNSQNISIEFKYLPWTRVLKDTKDLYSSAGFPAYYSKQRSKIYYFSDPIVISKIAFFKLKDRSIPWKKISDLSKYKVCTVRGYFYGLEFENNSFLKKEQSRSTILCLRKLITKKIDLVIGDAFVIKNLTKRDNLKGKINQAGYSYVSNQMHIIFSKKNIEGKKNKDVFNLGLKKIKKSGIYDSILKKYNYIYSEDSNQIQRNQKN